jgi:hypothetical protein
MYKQLFYHCYKWLLTSFNCQIMSNDRIWLLRWDLALWSEQCVGVGLFNCQIMSLCHDAEDNLCRTVLRRCTCENGEIMKFYHCHKWPRTSSSKYKIQIQMPWCSRQSWQGRQKQSPTRRSLQAQSASGSKSNSQGSEVAELRGAQANDARLIADDVFIAFAS